MTVEIHIVDMRVETTEEIHIVEIQVQMIVGIYFVETQVEMILKLHWFLAYTNFCHYKIHVTLIVVVVRLIIMDC